MARCHWLQGSLLVHFWRQSSRMILATVLDFLLHFLKVAGFPLCCIFPTGLRMLCVRCNVLWRTRSRNVTETLASDQNGEKETKANSRSHSETRKNCWPQLFGRCERSQLLLALLRHSQGHTQSQMHELGRRAKVKSHLYEVRLLCLTPAARVWAH